MKQTPQDLAAATECLLFVSTKPVPGPRLAAYLGVATEQVAGIIDELARRIEGQGLQVVEIAGGYNLATRPEYAELVQAFLEPDPDRLSLPALETLAIIAYRQPITRPEIDDLRGVNSAGVVHTLLDKKLIRLAGRKKAPGRPFLLQTTEQFLSVFGLKNLDGLPQLPELEPELPARGLPALPPPPASEEEEQPPSAGVSPD